MEACVQSLMLILYFVGMMRDQAGTEGAREIPIKLCIISASLESA